MTMFTRNDKNPEPATRISGPATEKPEIPISTVMEPKRPHTAPQPISATATPQSQFVSVISRALKITGQLESTENIQIDGEVEGDIRAVSVKVGSSAKVKGAVYGEEVELSGSIEGKIEAKKVVLTSSAHMSGDVIHQDLTVHSGAFLSGHCRPEFGKSDNARPTVVKPKDALANKP